MYQLWQQLAHTVLGMARRNRSLNAAVAPAVAVGWTLSTSLRANRWTHWVM